MSSNVGLSTPRGSGTSGYVQRNLSALKPRQMPGAPYSKDPDQWQHHKQRQPDKEILEHERKREIELKVFELRDKLEDEGLDEDEIDDRCDNLRKKLGTEHTNTKSKPDARGLKPHQVHELAEAKIEESEKLRKALGISKDYEEGSHWRRQEERMRQSLAGGGVKDEDDEDGAWREKVRARERRDAR